MDDGYGADSGPSQGDPRTRTSRPIEASLSAVCYVRNTSTPAVRFAQYRPLPRRFRSGSKPSSARRPAMEPPEVGSGAGSCHPRQRGHVWGIHPVRRSESRRHKRAQTPGRQARQQLNVARSASGQADWGARRGPRRRAHGLMDARTTSTAD